MSLKPGDYVLATKFADGDPCDHFCVGFFRSKAFGDRFLVEDADGVLFRASGFRRCERISATIGDAIVDAMPLISDGVSASLWYWRYHPEALKNLSDALSGAKTT